jgi:hypothetical protein
MKKIALLVSLVFLLTACQTNTPAPTPRVTLSLTATLTPSFTITPTLTASPTNTLTPTPAPVFITLGSPFASDFGDGIPRIWSNDAYNAQYFPNCNDDHHGHVDWFVPFGAYPESYSGEVIAPLSGLVTTYNDNQGNFLGINLTLDKGIYPEGIIDALKFAGIDDPHLAMIDRISLNMGHVKNVSVGYVQKGDSFADVNPMIRGANIHNKIAYKVVVIYNNKEIPFGPSLFPTQLSDGTILRPMLNNNPENWICVQGSPYDCVPEVKDYAPTCKFDQ